MKTETLIILGVLGYLWYTHKTTSIIQSAIPGTIGTGLQPNGCPGGMVPEYIQDPNNIHNGIPTGRCLQLLPVD